MAKKFIEIEMLSSGYVKTEGLGREANDEFSPLLKGVINELYDIREKMNQNDKAFITVTYEITKSVK